MKTKDGSLRTLYILAIKRLLNDARRAIRMIAADAIAEHKDIGSENMQIYTQKLIDRHKKS